MRDLPRKIRCRRVESSRNCRGRAETQSASGERRDSSSGKGSNRVASAKRPVETRGEPASESWPHAPACDRHPSQCPRRFDLQGQLVGICGVDRTGNDGIDVTTAQFLSGVGTDRPSLPTIKYAACGLVPRDREHSRPAATGPAGGKTWQETLHRPTNRRKASCPGRLSEGVP